MVEVNDGQHASLVVRRVRLINFAYGAFDGHRHLQQGRRPYYNLLWIHHGKVKIRFGGHEETLKRGQGVLVFPETEFTGKSVVASSQGSVGHFTIDEQGDPLELPLPFRRLLNQRQGYERYSPSSVKELLPAIDQSVRWAQVRQTPMMTELRVAHFTAILAQLSLTTEKMQAVEVTSADMDRLVEQLQLQMERPMHLEDMAAYVGLSVSHFRARFQQHFGISPGQYLHRLRLHAAGKLLRETTLPVKTISRQTGFSHVTGFYRAFRIGIGMSPIEHRRRHAPRA